MTIDDAPDMDDTPLVDGSLGLNQSWQTYRATRRGAGGQPITFKHTAQIRKAERDLYHALGRTEDFTVQERQREASNGTPTLTHTASGDADWMSISEYAKSKNTGTRKARKVMESLELLQPEIEWRSAPSIADPAQPKPQYRHALRLASWAVQAGLGKRGELHGRPAYDMLSPSGIEWLDARWPVPDAAKVRPVGRPVSNLREEVRALIDEGKPQAEIARMLGKSRSTISHHVAAIRGTD